MSALLSEQDATGKVKQVYDDIRQAFGMVPNFFKAQAAVDPDWLELNWQREKKIMLDDGALDRKRVLKSSSRNLSVLSRQL